MHNQSISPEVKGYYSLCMELVGSCFVMPSVKEYEDRTDVYCRRAQELIDFSESQLLKMICDCSDNLEHGKVQRKILEFTQDKLFVPVENYKKTSKFSHK